MVDDRESYFADLGIFISERVKDQFKKVWVLLGEKDWHFVGFKLEQEFEDTFPDKVLDVLASLHDENLLDEFIAALDDFHCLLNGFDLLYSDLCVLFELSLILFLSIQLLFQCLQFFVLSEQELEQVETDVCEWVADESLRRLREDTYSLDDWG